jgi:hypothetical protein
MLVKACEKFVVGRCDVIKLNEEEGEKQYLVKICNRSQL